MIKAVFFDLGDTLIAEEDVAGRHLWEVTLKKLPHTDDVLRQLKRKYKLGLITNTITSTEEHVRKALQRIGIEQFFDVILTSVDFGLEKPDPQIFIKALKTVNVKPEEAVMVGNRISTDILGGNKAGMKTILFRWNQRYPEKAGSQLEQATRTIKSLKELPRILSELNKDRRSHLPAEKRKTLP